MKVCTHCTHEVNKAFSFDKHCTTIDKILRKCVNKFRTEFKSILNSPISNQRKPNMHRAAVEKIVEDYVEVKQEVDPKKEYEEFVEEVKQEQNVKIECVEVKQEEELIIENDDLADETYSEKSLQIKKEPVELITETEEKLTLENALGDYEFVEIKQEPDAKLEYECDDPVDEETYSEESDNPGCRSSNLKTGKKSSYQKRNKYYIKVESSYECVKCSEKFPDFKSLKKHREENKHPQPPSACPICNKMIGFWWMKRHMRTHTGEKPYKCEICWATFSRSSNLSQHERNQHSDPNAISRDFRCTICNQAFTRKTLLRRHVAIHGEKQFLCSVCGRGFVTKDLLNSHSKIHTGVRPHACNVCGKAFIRLGHLKTHELIHTGEKPCVCSVCNRAFTHQTTLKSHLRTHTGEKPFTCGICSKSFIRNRALTVHIRTHTGEKPYICPFCGKGFCDSRSVKKHKLTHDEQI